MTDKHHSYKLAIAEDGTQTVTPIGEKTLVAMGTAVLGLIIAPSDTLVTKNVALGAAGLAMGLTYLGHDKIESVIS